MSQGFDELEEWAEADGWPAPEVWTDSDDWVEPGLVQALRRVTHESFAGASDEAYEDALDEMLGGMSAAEGFNFSSALSKIARGAGRVASNPLVAQVAGTALPVGTAALGTLIGGPAGTAIGSRLGTLAAGALVRPSATAGATVKPSAAAGGSVVLRAGSPAVAGGSAAAAQALIATQMPKVLEHVAAAALGRSGARRIDGLPVADVMRMLSSMFGQAAADADELAYLDSEAGDAESDDPDPALGSGRSLYTALVDAENEEFWP